MIWLILLAVVTLLYFLFMSPWSQLFGHYPYKAESTKKVVALTFDDGPNEPYTSTLLEFLKAENVVATFFLVGNCALRHPKMAQTILNDGHVIANHSLTHSFMTYFRPGRFLQEIKSTQDILISQTGVTPALYRSPWLWRQPFLLSSAKKLGLKPVGGVFCHPREVFGATARSIASAAINKAKPGTILIFHDGKEGTGGDRTNTIEAVKFVIKELKKQNYTFLTVDKLLNIPPYQK